MASVDKTACNKWFGKKLADGTQHQLLFRYAALVIIRRYKIGNSNNNELLIINLAVVPADEFQIPVLRQALNVMCYLMDHTTNIELSARNG